MKTHEYQYLVEVHELLVHEGVAAHIRGELCLLLGIRQLAVQQQVAAVCEVTKLCKLVNRVPAGDDTLVYIKTSMICFFSGSCARCQPPHLLTVVITGAPFHIARNARFSINVVRPLPHAASAYLLSD